MAINVAGDCESMEIHSKKDSIDKGKPKVL